MNDNLINSFKLAMTNKWTTEIGKRILTSYTNEVRSFKALHSVTNALDLDVSNWMKINELRYYLMKDSYTNKSLFTRLKHSIACNNLHETSELYLELEERMCDLRTFYSNYKKNLLDI